MCEPIDGSVFFEQRAQLAAGVWKKAPLPKQETARSEELSLPKKLFKRAEETGENDPETAMRLYQQLLKLEPQHAIARANLGMLYYNKGEFLKAKDELLAAINIEPDFPLAHFALGNTWDELGALAYAAVSYLCALKIDPSYADAHYNLALLYEKMVRPGKALRHWQAYSKLVEPGGPWHWNAVQRVKEIVQGAGLAPVPTQSRKASRK